MKIGPKKEKLKEYGRRYHNAKKWHYEKNIFCCLYYKKRMKKYCYLLLLGLTNVNFTIITIQFS